MPGARPACVPAIPGVQPENWGRPNLPGAAPRPRPGAQDGADQPAAAAMPPVMMNEAADKKADTTPKPESAPKPKEKDEEIDHQPRHYDAKNDEIVPGPWRRKNGKLTKSYHKKQNTDLVDKTVAKGQSKVDNVPSRPDCIRDKARLDAELALKEKGILRSNGKLTDKAIANSKPTNVKGEKIGNPEVRRTLTSDGSKIKDWQKFSTKKIDGPKGQKLEVHYYKNNVTGKIDYATKDFKIKEVIDATDPLKAIQ